MAFLTLKDIIKIIKKVWLTVKKDSTLAINLLSNEKSFITRIFNDHVKIHSLEYIVKKYSEIKLVFFWENRGHENYFIQKYPKRVISIQLGYEGLIGPTYVNYQYLSEIKSKFYVSSLIYQKMLKKRFPTSKIILKTIDGWKFNKFNNDFNKPKNNDSILFISSIEEEVYQTYLKYIKSKSVNNFLIRPHPTQVKNIPHYLYNKVDNSNVSDLLKKYNAFIFSSTTSLAFELAINGASVYFLPLVNRYNFLFDIGVSKIDGSTLINIKNKEWGRSQQNQLYFDDLVGDVKSIRAGDLKWKFVI